METLLTPAPSMASISASTSATYNTTDKLKNVTNAGNSILTQNRDSGTQSIITANLNIDRPETTRPILFGDNMDVGSEDQESGMNGIRFRRAIQLNGHHRADEEGRGHSPGGFSICSLSESASDSDSNCSRNTSQADQNECSRLAEADDDSYQSFFPLSKQPWSEVHAVQSPGVMLPLSGLMAEASCLVDVVQAEHDVRMAEQKLARCRVKESILKARLYKIQDAKAKRLLQISSTEVGRARAEVDQATRYQMPQPLHHPANSVVRV